MRDREIPVPQDVGNDDYDAYGEKQKKTQN
jgi:hypothetical protein